VIARDPDPSKGRELECFSTRACYSSRCCLTSSDLLTH